MSDLSRALFGAKPQRPKAPKLKESSQELNYVSSELMNVAQGKGRLGKGEFEKYLSSSISFSLSAFLCTTISSNCFFCSSLTCFNLESSRIAIKPVTTSVRDFTFKVKISLNTKKVL